MSKEDSNTVKVIPLRNFVTSKTAFKVGIEATVSKADARAFIRRKAAAEPGQPEAVAAIAAAKPVKKPAGK